MEEGAATFFTFSEKLQVYSFNPFYLLWCAVVWRERKKTTCIIRSMISDCGCSWHDGKRQVIDWCLYQNSMSLFGRALNTYISSNKVNSYSIIVLLKAFKAFKTSEFYHSYVGSPQLVLLVHMDLCQKSYGWCPFIHLCIQTCMCLCFLSSW